MRPNASVTGSSEGGEGALGALFDQHFGFVWNAFRRLGVRDAEREDLVQELFIKVHAKLGDYDPARPIRPWLFGFAYRIASDHRRLARHRFEVSGAPLDAIFPDRAALADASLQAAEERALVDRALDAVPIERRAVLVMHDLDEVPIAEVALVLSIPLNTAYSRLRVARGELVAAARRLQKQRSKP